MYHLNKNNMKNDDDVVSKLEAKKIEKQLMKSQGMLNRVDLTYNRLKKIEIRNMFKSMSRILNSYKKEYGKLNIDVKHVEPKQKMIDVSMVLTSKELKDIKDAERKIGQKLLITIRTIKNDVLLAIINYTLPNRVFSKLQKEEELINLRYEKIQSKREKLVERLKNVDGTKYLNVPKLLKTLQEQREEQLSVA